MGYAGAMMNEHTTKHRHYRILVAGHLDTRWQPWFDDLTVGQRPDGNTLLSGTLADQAALYGVLKRINNLGLTLISVESGESDSWMRST